MSARRMRKRSATSAKGWRCSKTCPATLERAQQELALQIALGLAFIATKGQTVAEVGHTYSRARELCQQVERMSRSSSGYCMACRIFM